MCLVSHARCLFSGSSRDHEASVVRTFSLFTVLLWLLKLVNETFTFCIVIPDGSNVFLSLAINLRF